MYELELVPTTQYLIVCGFLNMSHTRANCVSDHLILLENMIRHITEQNLLNPSFIITPITCVPFRILCALGFCSEVSCSTTGLSVYHDNSVYKARLCSTALFLCCSLPSSVFTLSTSNQNAVTEHALTNQIHMGSVPLKTSK